MLTVGIRPQLVKIGQVRRDLRWLLGLMVVVSVTYYLLPRPSEKGQTFHLELLLAADPQFAHQFRLTLENRSVPEWGGCTWVRTYHQATEPHGIEWQGSLASTDFVNLQTRLTQLGVWSVESARSSAPEADVLYTRLTVSQGERRHQSEWRGLPSDRHRALAACFLDGQNLLSQAVNEGLQDLQRYKASHPRPDHKIIPQRE